MDLFEIDLLARYGTISRLGVDNVVVEVAWTICYSWIWIKPDFEKASQLHAAAKREGSAND
jgi:hypothetical protein